MEPKTVGYAAIGTGANAITTKRTYNCQVVRTSAGIYTCTLGSGIDSTLCMPTITAYRAAADGAGTTISHAITHTSDLVKVLRFLDDAEAPVDPVAFTVEFKRYPPLPATV